MDTNTAIDPVNSPSQNPVQTSVKAMPVSSDTSADDDFNIDTTSSIELSEDPDSIYHYFVASPMYAGFGDLNSPERTYFLQDVNQMSPNLKNYLTSADTVESIFSLGKEFNLEDDQISELGIIVREFLTGKIFIKDFPSAISSKLSMDDTKAGELANKIISKSFGPILEDIKRIQRNKFPEKISQLQKESRPEGLTAKPPVKEEVKSMPLNKPSSLPPAGLGQNQTGAIPQQTLKPPQPQSQPQPIAQQPLRPPQVQPSQPGNRTSDSGWAAPKQTSEVSLPGQPQSMRPAPAMPIRPPSVTPRPEDKRPPLIMPPRIGQESRQITPPPRPELKIPNVGGLNSNQNSPSPIKNEPPPANAQKSLEAELEKVASVIDLRAKSGE